MATGTHPAEPDVLLLERPAAARVENGRIALGWARPNCGNLCQKPGPAIASPDPIGLAAQPPDLANLRWQPFLSGGFL